MRSVRIATWTSGEPVSLLSRALSLMTSALRSAVIDIFSFPRTSLLQIEAADDLQRSRQSLDQGYGTHVAVPSPIEPVIRAYPGPDATLTDRPCRFRGKRSEEHTSELQSLMRISYAVFCLKKKK